MSLPVFRTLGRAFVTPSDFFFTRILEYVQCVIDGHYLLLNGTSYSKKKTTIISYFRFKIPFSITMDCHISQCNRLDPSKSYSIYFPPHLISVSSSYSCPVKFGIPVCVSTYLLKNVWPGRLFWNFEFIWILFGTQSPRPCISI